MDIPVKRLRPLLGTYVEVAASGGDAEVAVAEAFEAIERVQKLLSFHDPESELSRLNRSGGEEILLDPVSACALRLARSMTRASSGRFNCTVGGSLVRQGVLPDPGVAEALDSGDASDIILRAGRRARLRRHVLVTLDGIAKGLAVDLAVRALRARGCSRGWVNAGGDIRAFGAEGLPVHRREEGGELEFLGSLRDAAIATSHVRAGLDSRFPGRIVAGAGAGAPECGVFTVAAPEAWRADALTKVAALTSKKYRAELVFRLGGTLIEREAS